MVQEKVSSANQSVTWINCNSYKGRQSDSKYYRDWQECLPLGACDNTAGTEKREGTSRLHMSHAGTPQLMEGPPSAGRVWNEALAMSKITWGWGIRTSRLIDCKGTDAAWLGSGQISYRIQVIWEPNSDPLQKNSSSYFSRKPCIQRVSILFPWPR